MTKKKKIWLIAGAAVVFVVIIILAVSKDSKVVYSVQSEKVQKGEIVSVVTATGSVRARTTVKISADVSAKIFELPVKEGDMVKKGDVLVRLDPTRYQASVSQVEAALAAARSAEKRAEAGLIEAKQQYQRGKSLHAAGLISDENHTQLQTSQDVSQANLESARFYTKQQDASLEEVKDALRKTTITSPIDGTVTGLNAEVGEIVMIGTMNNAGTVIMTVADLSTIEVEVDVDETDVARVKIGQDCKVQVDAFPDTSFKGQVTEVGNAAQYSGSGVSSADRVTNFTVKILLLDNVVGIKPGMTATADITTERRQDVFYLPIQAVVMRPDTLKKDMAAENKDTLTSTGAIAAGVDTGRNVSQKGDKKGPKDIEGVFKIVNGSAKFFPVKTGIADQQNMEIKDGVALDDEIIIGSYKILRTITEGAKVKVTKEMVKEEKKD
jgi:HlyD family secretion protein